MAQFSGSFSGKSSSQAMVVLKDVPGHEMSLIEISGPQTSSDPRWNGATVSYWGISDLTVGNGTQSGYFMNTRANGDTDRGTFAARVTTADGVTTVDGTWKHSGGTGAFSGVSGSGVYKGRLTSPTEMEVSWEGTYQLG
jgi:hypothetical protein